ncbi:hypothetical protein OAN61_01095 [bacterium]|nr:hypothetical protein [bacterium]
MAGPTLPRRCRHRECHSSLLTQARSILSSCSPLRPSARALDSRGYDSTSTYTMVVYQPLVLSTMVPGWR